MAERPDVSEAARMRILLVSHHDQGTAAGGYPDLLAAGLEERGHFVERFWYDQLRDTGRRYCALTATRRYCSLSEQAKLTWRLRRAVRRCRADVLLLAGSNHFLGTQSLRLVRQSGMRLVLWEGNLAFGLGMQVEALRSMDLVFVSDSYILPYLRQIVGHPNVQFIQGYAVPEVFEPPVMDDAERARFAGGVSFIGNCYGNRADFFRELGRPVRLWGRGWEGKPGIALEGEPGAIDPADKAKVYAASAINLHLRAGDQQVHAFSTRVWEAPLCGGFLLAEESPDLLDCFEGDEIATFRTVDEARENIDYYLSRPAERAAMVARMRSRILRDWCFRDTIAEMDGHIRKLFEGPVRRAA